MNWDEMVSQMLAQLPEYLGNVYKESLTKMKDLVYDLRVMIGGIVFRFCSTVYFLPLVMRGNIVNLFCYWRKNKKSKIRMYIIVSICLPLLYFVWFVIWAIVSSVHDFQTFTPGYTRIASTGAQITEYAPVRMCGNVVDDWSVLDTSALTVVAELSHIDFSSALAFSSEAFQSGHTEHSAKSPPVATIGSLL